MSNLYLDGSGSFRLMFPGRGGNKYRALLFLLVSNKKARLIQLTEELTRLLPLHLKFNILPSAVFRFIQ